MEMVWRPVAGQVALIEPLAPGADRDCLTGVVLPDDAQVLIDLGASPRPSEPRAEVVASFFAPDALYRLSATAISLEDRDGLVVLDVHETERVQRRASQRLRVSLPATMASLDGPG